MRIVLVCRIYPTQRAGGMPFVVQDRAEALAACGHDVHVLTTWKIGGDTEVLNGVTIHYLRCTPQQYSREFAAACASACRQLEPEILHLDSFDRSLPWWTERPGDPRIVAVTMHGFGMGAFLTTWNLVRCGADTRAPSYPYRDMIDEAKALASFDRVLAISEHERYLLEDCYQLQKVSLVYNPIAACFFQRPTVAPPKRRRFLCAAVSGKGTRMFQRAELAARDAEIELFIAENMVRDKMPQVLDECSALVLPTAFAQGYDLTVAEALARRRPVIVSATGSYLRELRADPALPFVIVPIGDVEAICQAMLGDLPMVPDGIADRHRPRQHVAQWLKALGFEQSVDPLGVAAA